MADTAAASTGGSASTTTATTTTAGRYNPEEAGRKLLELDALVPQVAAALHQDKFKQVQVRARVCVLGLCVGACLGWADGGWRMEDGGWMMDDGGWMMEDGGWRMEGSKEALIGNVGGGGGVSPLI